MKSEYYTLTCNHHVQHQMLPIKDIPKPENPANYPKDDLLKLALTIEKLGFTFNPIIIEKHSYKEEYKFVKGEFEYQAAVICSNITGYKLMEINVIIIPDDADFKKAFNEALDEQINILQKEISP